MKAFSSVLVANRGEIALRVMRGARSLGLRSIAVYSDADAQAPHVKYADDAVYLGAAPAGESYLVAEKIIAAALSSGAGAIHPGYGFLSENADFARMVEAAGLVFIGPSASAIEVMGDKAVSKRAMIGAGVPCVPGYQGEEQSDERLVAEAREIGFPLMVKAAAGGGGRGMRLVESAASLASAISTARSEAKNAFGSDELIIEKAIIRPRHVEIQVFADQHGHVVHLGERDCSVQRRHQKVVEESPCPVMTADLRERMGAAAVEAARAVDYVGAGTVEFLLDEKGHFYFLEMNTRLQVEHPVTEMVTGKDLVVMQLEVAQGQPLNFSQAQVELQGHAIEVRLYAEDPAADFLPCTGPVSRWSAPTGEGIRVDAGIESGGEVTPFYDPMLAKIIASGNSREQARQRLIRALEQTVLFGVRCNRDFLLDVLRSDSFAEGTATTAFIAEAYPNGYPAAVRTPEHYAVSALLQYMFARKLAGEESLGINPELLEWSSTSDLESVLSYATDDGPITLRIHPQGGDRYAVLVDEKNNIQIELLALHQGEARLLINGRRQTIFYMTEPDGRLHLTGPDCAGFTVIHLSAGEAANGEGSGSGFITAPMHGCLVAVEVAQGDDVKVGDRLAVLEAMKMQHTLLADIDGKVASIAALVGAQLSADDLIVHIEACK